MDTPTHESPTIINQTQNSLTNPQHRLNMFSPPTEPETDATTTGLGLDYNPGIGIQDNHYVEVLGESEPDEEPVEYEDMQEVDYQVYDDYEANHQADLSALEHQSSIDNGEPEINGEYVTPTASDFDLQMYEAEYGEAMAEPQPAEEALAAALVALAAEEEDLAVADQLAMEFLAHPPDPNQEELVEEEVINPTMQDQQSLRRSARISVRGFTKNYSPKKSRGRKKPPNKSNFTESDLLKALQTEALQVTPLDQGKLGDIEQYCGIEDMGAFSPHGEGPSNTALDLTGENNEEYGESIIGDLEFNSDDDRFTDEENPSDGEGH